MKRALFDLHCDTALDLYTTGVPLASNNLHIALDKVVGYSPYTQVMAIWSDSKKCDEECFRQFIAAKENLEKEISLNSDKAALCKSYAEIEKARSEKKLSIILAVEDARLLAGDLSRLDFLHGCGVRFLTLAWGAKTIIGGSFDTDFPLTDFGKRVVGRCFDLGIIPDISHSSEYVADEVAQLSKERVLPFVATHSNAYTAYSHRRNLRDRHIEAIKACGGVIGISLCPKHLTDTDKNICTASDVLRHIDYYMSRGCENTLALGCDLDGTDLPSSFENISDIYKIAESMAINNYPDNLIEKVFFQNANNFIKNNLK